MGTVRNVERSLSRDVSRLNTALGESWQKSFHFVESDSTDRTLKEILKLQLDLQNVTFESLGNLQNKIPDRIERIRFCRQRYIAMLRERQTAEKWDFVLICDLDGINNSLSPKGVETCFNSGPSWDACFPVQSQGYYDLFALRHFAWMPINCFTQVKDRESEIVSRVSNLHRSIQKLVQFFEIDKIRRIYFYSRMLKLQNRPEWIPVRSAFGGLGFYKAESLLNHDYTLLGLEEETYSEHIDLHHSMNSAGLNLYINPKFINSSWNSYNLNRHFMVRVYRKLGLRLRG